MQRFVILSDYGGPDQSESVVPFLRELFRDPRILNLPAIFRYPLAALLSRIRARKARAIYREIGGSPVVPSVSAICSRLNQAQDAFRFMPGFLYMQPRLKDVARALAGSGPVLVLPTFPHHAFSTYGSMMDAVSSFPDVQLARPYATDPEFVNLLADHVSGILAGWPPDATVVLCVAHAVPVSHVRRGDVYVTQVREQVAMLSDRLAPFKLDLAFQSPLGPVEWVGPFAADRLGELVGEGVRRVLVVPLSFTVDNSETLYDLDKVLAAVAGTIGLEEYRRASCLNGNGRFERFLLDWARRELPLSGYEDREGRT